MNVVRYINMFSSSFRKILYFCSALITLSYIHSFFLVDLEFLQKRQAQADSLYQTLNTSKIAKNEILQKISINSASLEELCYLPRIGPVLAKRIIDFRKRRSFERLEDLKEVRGIGEKSFSRLKNMISL